ncbi:MAG: ATP-binding protein [Gemmatimonadota bacterium]|nr:ATP-binding protein [Gemmatimonadota bacterium]
MHKLLARQVRKFFGDDPKLLDTLAPFLASVDAAYTEADADRAMVERSLEVVSGEMAERYASLRDAIDRHQDAAHAVSALEATLESTADAILVVNREGQILHWNTKFAEMWSLPQELLEEGDSAAMIDAVLEQLVDPRGFRETVRQLFATPDLESFDVLQFRDGRVVERFSLPHRMEGRTVGRVWSFRDVTERRQLEERLRQSQKMEAVGLLAGGIAHDFNNLLTVIHGHTELLEGALEAGDPRLEHVNEIGAAATRATALTRQLLAFGRKQVLQSVVFALDDVVDNLAPMLRRLIGADIAIVRQRDDVPGLVLADRGQIEQVVLNLVINARDAMPDGGQLTIRTATVTYGADDDRPGGGITPPGEYVLLAVADTGIGIPSEIRDRVFEPFFTTKELGKGTGLGLSTLYGIIKQLQGFIWLESEVGRGSTFTILLPRVPDPDGRQVPSLRATTATSTAVGSADPGGGSILVAEDEESVRRVIERVLREDRHTLLLASDGDEALRLAAAHDGRIDLLITDIVMPGVGGLHLSEELRKAHPGLRVLLISGYTEQEIGHHGVLDAGVAFLHKPFSVGALRAAVRAALRAIRGNTDGVATS